MSAPRRLGAESGAESGAALPRWFVWRRQSGRLEGERVATVEASSAPAAAWVGERASGRGGHYYATPAPSSAPLSAGGSGVV